MKKWPLCTRHFFFSSSSGKQICSTSLSKESISHYSFKNLELVFSLSLSLYLPLSLSISLSLYLSISPAFQGNQLFTSLDFLFQDEIYISHVPLTGTTPPLSHVSHFLICVCLYNYFLSLQAINLSLRKESKLNLFIFLSLQAINLPFTFLKNKPMFHLFLSLQAINLHFLFLRQSIFHFFLSLSLLQAINLSFLKASMVHLEFLCYPSLQAINL